MSLIMTKKQNLNKFHSNICKGIFSFLVMSLKKFVIKNN